MACAVGCRVVLRALDFGFGAAAFGAARQSPIRIKTRAICAVAGEALSLARSVPQKTVGAGPCPRCGMTDPMVRLAPPTPCWLTDRAQRPRQARAPAWSLWRGAAANQAW